MKHRIHIPEKPIPERAPLGIPGDRRISWSPDAGALFLPVDAPSIPDLPAATNPVPSVHSE
ncbi:hypothetical protein [Roseinatronobacter bogoriensis]|uniref:hypothetical protein n=1 Tax=Roseinatronobacter bogoriensis TaxID=119542 RepID=UPI001062FC5D|nr:hypothetical protein [Rhodobaca]MBB4209418.1 hypothetical protein [Rhodobaca bogoriensis DSM 18756]